MEASTLDIAGLRGPAQGNWPLGRLWSDERLVERIQAGDKHSFSVLYSRYKTLVFAICLGVLGSREDAEDATQEVFVAAARRLDADVAPDNLKAWLARVARNSAIDYLRSRRRTAALPASGEPLDLGSEPHSIVERRGDLRAVMRGLGTLSVQQRSVLLLRELTGFSYEEIAELVGSDVMAVRDNIKRARLGLRVHREGENMACSGVRERLAAEVDARRRPKELKIHLRSCAGCRQFQLALQSDSRTIRALAPSLALVLLWRAQTALAATQSGLIKMKAQLLSGGAATKLAVMGITVLSVGALTITTTGDRLGYSVTPIEALDSATDSTLPSAGSAFSGTRIPSTASSAHSRSSSNQTHGSTVSESTVSATDDHYFVGAGQNLSQRQSQAVTYTPGSTAPTAPSESDDQTTQENASTQTGSSDSTSKTQSSDDSARSEDQTQSGQSPGPVPSSVSSPSPQAQSTQPAQPTQPTQATTNTTATTAPPSSSTSSSTTTTASPKKPSSTYLPTFTLPTLTVPTLSLSSSNGLKGSSVTVAP